MPELKRKLELKDISIETSSTAIASAQEHGWLSEGTLINSSGHFHLLNRSGAFINPTFQTSLIPDKNMDQFRISPTPAFGVSYLVQRILRRNTTQEDSLIAIGWQGRDLHTRTNEVANITFGVLQKREYSYAYPEVCVGYPNNLVDVTLYTPRRVIPPNKLTGKEADIFYNSILKEPVTQKMLTRWFNFSNKHLSLLPTEITQAIHQAIQDIRFSSNYKDLNLQLIY